MIIAHYIGPAKPGLQSRLIHWLITTGQKGPYGHCTHTEAVHAIHGDGTVTIASASLADKGVRSKRVKLNLNHWIFTDVPQMDTAESIQYFDGWQKAGAEYDKWGALATMLPGQQDPAKLFCTESVLLPFIKSAHYFTPAQGLALCLSLGHRVTRTRMSKVFQP